MEENFIRIATLVGEPARAAMLWNLLDGRAYTAGELAQCADLSASAASNHLHKLVAEGLLTIERQGRHKYFTFANPQIASVIEAMGAILPTTRPIDEPGWAARQQGLWYCRRCYDHLAGHVGVQLTDALLRQDVIRREETLFSVTASGAAWLRRFNIDSGVLACSRRPLARPCLDWSERKVHLGGSLGQALFEYFVSSDWVRLTKGSRAVVLTGKGHQHLSEQMGIRL